MIQNVDKNICSKVKVGTSFNNKVCGLTGEEAAECDQRPGHPVQARPEEEGAREQ